MANAKMMQRTMDFLDRKGIKYSQVGDDNQILKISYNGLDNKPGSIAVNVFFDDDGESVALRVWNYYEYAKCDFDEVKAVCCKVNAQFRWVKFYPDESDNTVTMSVDAVTDSDTVGAVVAELVGRCVSIGDDAYVEFKKI